MDFRLPFFDFIFHILIIEIEILIFEYLNFKLLWILNFRLKKTNYVFGILNFDLWILI